MKSFFASVWSTLIIVGMFTGLYSPRQAAFVVPPPPGTAAYEGETLTLAENGLSGYVIVVGETAIPAEMTASEKLQGFLKQISGAALEIVPDSVDARDREIVIGDTNRFVVEYEALGLGAEGFVIKTEGEKIIIAGGKPRGTLYGVYDFLEKFLGCRWFNKENKVIPQLEAVKVPAVIDELEIPVFEYRAPTTVQGSFDIDCVLAHRVNYGGIGDTKAPEYGGQSGYVSYHNGDRIMSEVIDGETYFMSSSEYFEKHRDLFAKDSGGNPVGGYSNPCFSNPEVLDIYEAYIHAQMEENPALDCISIALNDAGQVCQCGACKDAYWEECGIPKDIESRNCSGSHFRFLNELCERVAALYPGLKISTLAYAVTEQPPKLKLHPNAMIFFCPIGMCYAHRAGECSQPETRETFDVNFESWAAICDNIVVYDYPLTYNHWGVPFPVWDNIQSYLQYYSTRNVLGLMNCSSAVDDVGLYQLTGYIYARLLWNPDIDMEDIYSAFLPGYYGGGWQYIREYIRFVGEHSGKTIGKVTYHIYCLNGGTKTGNLAIGNRQLKYIDKLWENAKSMTLADNTSNPELAARQHLNLRRAELSWRFWKTDAFRGEFWPLNLRASRTKSNTALFNDILELGIQDHSEGGSYYVSREDFEKLGLKHLTARYWSWRQLGRHNEGNIHNTWQMLWALIH